MTQNELAEKMGVSKAAVSQIIGGDYSPSLNQLERVADALGVDVVELLAPVTKCPYCGRTITSAKKVEGES